MTTTLFDTHFHLTPDDDPAAVLGEARGQGIAGFVLAAGNAADTIRGLTLAETAAGLWCTAGLHPHEAESDIGDLAEFRDLADRKAVVAIGEIGLDYHYDFAPRDRQRRVLARFLDLAAETGLPVVIHCRDAQTDCLAIVADHLPAGHPRNVHCFTGTPGEALTWLDTGAMLSFNGMLTFRQAGNIRASFAVVPMDRILLETDAPYLAPVPMRGKPNRPAHLVHVAAKAAALRCMPVAEMARVTTANACRFFAVPEPRQVEEPADRGQTA